MPEGKDCLDAYRFRMTCRLQAGKVFGSVDQRVNMTWMDEIPEVDWSNSEIQRVVEVFGWKYAQKCKEITEKNMVIATMHAAIAEKDTTIAEKDAIIEEKDAEIAELKKQLESKKEQEQSDKTENRRSYNTREFKDYPKVKRSSKPKKYVPYDTGHAPLLNAHEIVEVVADITVCPVHGTPLSEKPTDKYNRTTEDAKIGGEWCIFEWTIYRRYCKKCGKQHTALPENVLPGEHFGINVMSQIFVLRNLVMSFETIQKIFLIIYDRFIHISTLEGLYHSASDKCRPLYEDMLWNIKNNKTMRGDHTGWYLNGKNYNALVLVTPDTVLYNMTPIKAGMTMESILQDFDGIMLSDSDSSWNAIGTLWQKCLLHYIREIDRTLKDNKSEEFKKFGEELKLILKRAIKLDKDRDGDKTPVPENLVLNLQKRIDNLIEGNYTDGDCTRFVKRLRRERTHLLTFLVYDIEFHNNACELGARLMARMRKVCYGSRSERGLQATETMGTIYATCEKRRINPYHFMMDFLNGRLTEIPNPGKDSAIDAPNAAKTSIA